MILAGGRACLPVFRCDIFERHYPRTRRRDNLCQLILGKIEKTVNVRLRSGCLVVLIAARAGDLKKVKSLVNDGVDPDNIRQLLYRPSVCCRWRSPRNDAVFDREGC